MSFRSAPLGKRRFRLFPTARRAALAAVLCVWGALLGAAAPAVARDDRPGAFDFYVLALSWSPTYCESGDASQEQCDRRRPFSFVVHGLWPQYERGFPERCQRPAPFVEKETIRGMMDIMPSWDLVLHQWRKHGTCSGLGAKGYFDLVRRAKEKVAIPTEFTRLNSYRMVAPADLEAAFRAANPGLKPDMMSVDCDRRRLREVRICMNRDLSFRACAEVDRRACRLPKMAMPPVRGGN